MAYVRRRRDHFIEFPDTEAYICRVCETYIAKLEDFVARGIPPIPDPDIRNRIEDPTVTLRHAFNFESGTTERRFQYVGEPITCRSCLAYLGYRYKTRTYIDDVTGTIHDVDLEAEYFELETAKLYIRLSNGEFQNAESREPIVEIPPAFQYTPDKNYFLCNTCNCHLALDQEVIAAFPIVSTYAVFNDIRGMKNVYLGSPFIRYGERRVKVHCFGCCKSLGHMIAEVENVEFTNPHFQNGRLVLDMTEMDFWCCERQYYLSISVAHRPPTAAHRLPIAVHRLPNDLAELYYSNSSRPQSVLVGFLVKGMYKIMELKLLRTARAVLIFLMTLLSDML